MQPTVVDKKVLAPSTQRKTLAYSSEPWRPLRLCARYVFSDLFFIPNSGLKQVSGVGFRVSGARPPEPEILTPETWSGLSL
jgi:hypothetical protein